MGFRNDADALLARAEALERENRELRKKIAERKDLDDVEAENKKLHDEVAALRDEVDDKKARQEAAAAKARAARETARQLRKDNRALKKTLGEGSVVWEHAWVVFPAAFVILSAWSGISKCRSSLGTGKVELGKAHIIRLELIDMPGAPPTLSVLFSQERKRRKGNRYWSLPSQVQLTAIDLRTGKHAATLTLYEPARNQSTRDYHVYKAAGHLAWANHPVQGLQLLDLETPAVLMTREQIEGRVGALGAHRIQGARGRVVTLVTASGALRTLDMAKLVAKPPPALPPLPESGRRRAYPCGQRWGLQHDCRRDECVGFASIKDSTAMQLGYRKLGGYGEPTPASANATPLIGPRLMHRLGGRCVFERDDTFLVTHNKAAVGRNNRQLSLIDRQGRTRWTQPWSAVQYQTYGAASHGKTSYVFTHGSNGRGMYVVLNPDGTGSKHVILRR